MRYDFLREQILKYNFFEAVSHNFLQYLNEEDQQTYLNAVKTMQSRYLKSAYAQHLI